MLSRIGIFIGQLSLLSMAWMQKICIYSDSNSCLGCDSVWQQKRLDDITIHNGTILSFCSDSIWLNKMLIIQGVSDVELSGRPNASTELFCSTGISAGMFFARIENLKIEMLTVRGCSLVHEGVSGGIFIINSSRLSIVDVAVLESCGTGLIILNTFGSVNISQSTFQNNSGSYSSESIGGGGLYIELNTNTSDHYTSAYNAGSVYSSYTLANCRFINNNISSKAKRSPPSSARVSMPFSKFGGGGGLSIILFNRASENSFFISSCFFLSNKAYNGGGMYVGFRDASSSNIVEVLNSNFTENCCLRKGGGGIEVGFVPPQTKTSVSSEYFPRDNQAKFVNCLFGGNEAYYGGGASIYALQNRSYSLQRNLMHFVGCTWENNVATIGAAVDLSSHIWNKANGLLPKVIFTNCKFYFNFIKNNVTIREAEYVSRSKGEGGFFSVGYVIQFCGLTEFIGNNGTSLYLASSVAEFSENSRVLFKKNSGFAGGAISMIGFSAINLKDNSTVEFISNCAEGKGGAIHVESLNQKDAFSTYSCFFQYMGQKEDSDLRQVNVIFSDNRVGCIHKADYNGGHSIYATTLKSCYRKYLRLAGSQGVDRINSSVFNCIGNYTFKNLSTGDLATSGNIIKMNREVGLPLKIIPGKHVALPIVIEDDLEQEVKEVFHVTVINADNSDIVLHPSAGYYRDRWVNFHGTPGNMADVLIETVNDRIIDVSFKVEMSNCPPGYVSNIVTYIGSTHNTCVCSASTTAQRMKGIHQCNMAEYVALIGRGYFIGYFKENNGSEFGKDTHQFSSYCPPGYCSTNRPNEKSSREYKLTNTSSIAELDELICGPNRTGRVCGRCKQGYSVFYHSSKYQCKKSSRCHLGVVFYLLTEILPVTLFFLVIILLDIKLTSGAFSSFVFFSQVVDTLMVSANGFIVFPDQAYQLLRVSRLITRMFSLNFFSLKELSFCLWSSANPLDIIMFKYVTIFYALLLVAAIVISLRFNSCSKIMKKLGIVSVTPQTTVIHGLTGFLVICYSECVRISLLILTPVTLNSPWANKSNTVVFYNGEMHYLLGKHLFYAIPAVVLFVAFGIIPPVLLIVYPLCYKVFALLRINETRLVPLLCKMFPLEMLKPLFDAFQSSFKDNCRYFSGLYFVYRLTILSSYVLLHNFAEFYLMIQLQLTAFLAFHAIVQPYRIAWHNVLDGCIFMLLASLNAMTLFNYKLATELLDYKYIINIVSTVQIFLIYVPIVYMVLYCTMCLFRKCKYIVKWCQEKAKKRASNKHKDVALMLQPKDLGGNELLGIEFDYRHLED